MGKRMKVRRLFPRKSIKAQIDRVFILCLSVVLGVVMFVGCGSDNNGKFYTLQEAYINGWLTQNDIMEVCYYRFNEVWTGETLDSDSWVKYEYTPKHTRQELDWSVENDIKKTYYSIHKSDFFDREGNPLGGIDNLSVQYFGIYNDSYVIVMKCSLWDIGQIATPTLLAGVAWWETGEGFLVYRVN